MIFPSQRRRVSFFRRLIIAVFIVMIPTFALALDCESEEGELIVCSSIPAEAPASSAPEQARLRNAPSKMGYPNDQSLLSRDELAGGDAAQPFNRPARPGSNVNAAMLAGLEAQEQIRRIELFLKSGPAQRGDLRVVEASKDR